MHRRPGRADRVAFRFQATGEIDGGPVVTGEAAVDVIEAAAPGKTVVLTGAMIPYSIDGSDAAFNIGIAYAAAQLLPAGVYIAMHGRVLPHTAYAKDRSQGRFIAAGS